MSPPIPALAGTTSNAKLFHKTFATLSSKTKEGLAERTSSWSQADPNGNSYISLAEIDAFILEKLKTTHGDDTGAALHKEYRPAYLLAFNRSKSLAPTQQATAHSTSDDYLTKKEFRLFFVNLLFHVLALDCFAIVDGGGAGVDAGDDRRITPKELEDAASTVCGYGFVGLKDAKDAAGAASVFANMDANGGGVVLLEEFCAYLIAKEMEAKTDIGKEMDVDLSKAPTPAKTKKGSGGVPHFMSPITPTTGKAKTTSGSGSTRSATKSTPSTASKKPVRRPPTSAAKSKTASTTPSSTAKAKTKASTKPTSTSAVFPTPTKSKKKPTVADPLAPKFRKPGPSADLRLFQSTFEPLVDLKDPHAKKDRAAAWKNADPNGNGMLSLAEVDSWIQTALVAKHRQLKGRQLYKLFRPAYILAFNAAKSLAEGGSDDYVTKKEFRLMIAYLNLYANLLDAFAAIDGGGPGVDANDDRRISCDEWMKGHHSVSTFDWSKLHKITDAEASEVFDQMDANSGGMVLLNEWCDYLIRAEVRAGSDTGKLLSKIPKYSSMEDEVEVPPKDNSAAERKAAAEAKRLEDERIAQEKAAAEAKRREERRIAEEKAAAEKAAAEEAARIAEAKRLEEQRIADEKAAAEEAARIAEEKAAAEAQRIERERLEKERVAAEKAEAARLEEQRIAEEKAAAEAARLEEQRLEQERIAAEKAEAERLEQERIAAEKAEAERLEQGRIASEKKAAEEAQRLEQERLEQERLEQERIAAEKKAAEEAQRLEQERIAAEKAEAERLEQERIAAEAARLEEQRIADEKAAAEAAEAQRLEEHRLEQERIAEEKAEADRLEQERLEQERLEKERLEQERLEQERIAAEKAEANRLEQERLETDRIAAEKADADRLEQERIEKEEAELKALEEEEARIAAEEAELKALEEEEARLAAEEQAAREAEILRQKELEAQRLNEEIQQEQAAEATTEAPVSSLASSLQRAAPFASSLRAAAGSSLAAAAKKASSLAEEVKKEMNGE